MMLLKRMIFPVILLFVSMGCGNQPQHDAGDDNKNPGTLAITYLQQGKFDEAEVSFKKAIKENPKETLYYADLSLLYLLQKNFDAAEKQVKAGLESAPGNTDLELILAEVYAQKKDPGNAIRQLQAVLAKDPRNVKAYYKLADLAADAGQRKQGLLKVVDIVPANIVPRMQLSEMLASEGKADSARYYLESIKKMTPDFNRTLSASYGHAIAQLQAGNTAGALPYLRQFVDMMKVSIEYQRDDVELNIFKLVAGYAVFTSSRYEHQARMQSAQSGNILDQMRFTEATASAGLPGPQTEAGAHGVMAVADYDVQGYFFVYTSVAGEGATSTQGHLFSSKVGAFTESKDIDGLDHEGQDLDAVFADFDNDGYQDLFVSTTRGTVVFHNGGDGSFSRVKEDIGLKNAAGGQKILFFDYDQDGDLDYYLACEGGNKLFRNNGDGTFAEESRIAGLTGIPPGSADMDFGDLDSDGDLDVVAVDRGGKLSAIDNGRHARFSDISDSLRLGNPAYRGSAVALADYNNDGMLDIFLGGGAGGTCFLLTNRGGKGFVADTVSGTLSRYLKEVKVDDAAFVDFDNDGHEDLLVAGTGKDASARGVWLFHNDTTKGFSDASRLLPDNVKSARHIEIADYNGDGDYDIFLAGADGVHLLRNDGGNTNNFLQVQLVGLSYGNSKNNRLGIGAQVELRAGDLYQMKTVRRSSVQFGVGGRDSMDAVRVIWPNGVPQVIPDPQRFERTLEKDMLKGSCPFLYTWNGRQFEFVKDMMWRSVMGMPLSISGKDTVYSFGDASKEYLLIPGEKLQARDGKYTLKVSEELWEAVYFDKAQLAAVDHPDSINTYVDERFVAPPFPGRKIYPVARKYFPVSAMDGKGNNLLPKLSAYDFQFVSSFDPGKYQGVAEDHDLILDLGREAVSDSLFLFLRGWIFPTDASISTALTQTGKYKVRPPSLQVMDKNGQWRTVIDNLGFPMGRDKTVIANLSGKFLTSSDRRVRIRTNMQIYWDEVFFSTGNAKAPVHLSELPMLSATLAYRGFSASYRKGGPYGPEWFDYYNTSGGQKWRDLTGYYTRYGDVKPLLQKADDEYVIANGGDVITMEFDGRGLASLPRGWKRDFLIYSEGWVKDGDLNTACGQTVEPLPFHAMPSYPYSGGVAYPSDRQHLEYRRRYNTREVNTLDFRNAFKPASR